MRKFTALFMAAMCASGCRNITHVEVAERPVASPFPTAPAVSGQWEGVKSVQWQDAGVAPETPAQAKEAPKAPPAPENKAATPVVTTTRKDPGGEVVQPFQQARTGAPKATEGPRTAVVASESGPAGTPKKDMSKKGAKNRLGKTAIAGLPRDVWYVIATVAGAVFTYIVAPILVDIIKGRMALASPPHRTETLPAR